MSSDRHIIPASSSHRLTVALTGTVNVAVTVAVAGLAPADAPDPSRPPAPPAWVAPTLDQFATDLTTAIATRIEGQIMSQLTPHLDALEKAIGDVESREAAGHQHTSDQIASLQTQIADLQAKIDAGQASDADLARIDQLTERLNGLDIADQVTPPATPDSGEPAAPPADPGQPAPPDQTPPADANPPAA